MLWDKVTGEPVHNAVVWMDTRTADLVAELTATGGQDQLRGKTGLPLATYFSGLKLRWLLDNVPGARARAEAGELLFGNIDTWLAWKLTGLHITDVTNASPADTRLALRGFSQAARGELFPETIAELEAYPDIPATEYVVVLSQLWRLRAAVAEFFDRYDLMVMPATAVPAFPLRRPPTRIGTTDVKPGWETAMPFAALWNMTGQPTASLPCGLTPEGLPVGLMIVGRFGAEIDVLRASASLEMAMPWSTQVPRLRWSSGSS